MSRTIVYKMLDGSEVHEHPTETDFGTPSHFVSSPSWVAHGWPGCDAEEYAERLKARWVANTNIAKADVLRRLRSAGRQG